MEMCDIDHIIGKKAPLGAKLMAAAREGHLCIQKKGREGCILNGDEKWFDGLVGRWGDLVYFQKNWVLEGNIVREFMRLLAADVKRIELEDSGPLNEGQRRAAKMCLEESVVCLTGGPGTGKSYVIGEIVKRWPADISVCAPTGKAAALLQEKLQMEVKTLHGLLGVGSNKEMLFGEKVLETDMIIVDECSMIDAGMWSALLRSVKKKTRLILVGDHHQLPPVEAGMVFKELCDFMKKRGQGYSHLDECMRSDRTEILEKASAVREGKVIEYGLLKPDVDRWQKEGYQVLSCLRKGPFGVEAINELMQGAKKVPIMITQNDRRMGLSNGEMGLLLKKEPGKFIGKDDIARFGSREFPAALLPEFEPAHCISVHKSQGSEFEKVVLLVPKGSEVFGREILYTGITRAKEALVVLSEEGVIEACVKRESRSLSGIRRRLCAF